MDAEAFLWRYAVSRFAVVVQESGVHDPASTITRSNYTSSNMESAIPPQHRYSSAKSARGLAQPITFRTARFTKPASAKSAKRRYGRGRVMFVAAPDDSDVRKRFCKMLSR